MNRSQAGRIAALEKAAKPDYDGTEATAKMRRTFRDSFLTAVDPEGALPEAERQQKADRAYRAHMIRLAERSAAARRRR